MADQQPCLEPARTMHPVMATLDPSFQSVLSLCAANPTHLCVLAGTCCKAAEDKTWHPSSSLQTGNAPHTLSGRISLTTLVCLAYRSSVVPYQAKEQQSGQPGCKAKAESSTPCPVPTQSKPKTNYCSQLNTFKKQIQS